MLIRGTWPVFKSGLRFEERLPGRSLPATGRETGLEGGESVAVFTGRTTLFRVRSGLG